MAGSPIPNLRFQARIADDIVVDGEVEELVAGNIITLGFRAFTARDARDSLVGSIVWARLDERSGLEEGIVAAGGPPLGIPFLIQSRTEVATMGVGDTVQLDRQMASIRPYEYEAFQLPDVVHRRWLLHSVERDPGSLDWLVQIEPLDRHSKPLRLPPASEMDAPSPTFKLSQSAAVATEFRVAGFDGPLRVASAIKGDERLFVLTPAEYGQLQNVRHLEEVVAQILQTKVFITDTGTYDRETELFK